MPLWHIYHAPSAFPTAEGKGALAAALTAVYAAAGLPAFYVNVYFHEVAAGSIWIGGVPQLDERAGAAQTQLERPFVRLVGEHIAVSLDGSEDRQRRFLTRLDAALKPHIADKGYDWEYHIDETPRHFWKVQGLNPPPHGSEVEARWAKENKAMPWEEGEAKI